jgi:type I restriction enzyme R subunit
VLDWRKEQRTRAAVRVAVTLDRLPENYTRQIYAQECDAVYQHVFESYFDGGQSVYDRAA